MNVLAFDLGGTRLKAGIVEGGTVQTVHVEDAPVQVEGDDLVERLRRVSGSLGAAGFGGVGLCVPGLVRAGVVTSLPGKLEGLEGIDLAAMLWDAFSLPATVCNDAQAYAVGEAVAGAGAGSERVLVVTIGTGIGTTLVVKGVPDPATILGGFIPISDRDRGPTDSIGRSDTIEALCRADRIAGGAFPDAAATFEALERADPAAHEAVTSYRRDLVRACAALASAHAPDVIVLGGGPMTPSNPITPGVEGEVNARMFGSYRVAVRVAALQDGAALVGLAHLVESSR